MAGETSLLDWILSLLRDPDARASFQADPSGYAARHGFEGLSAADVHDALYLIADNGSASYDYQFGRWSEAHYPPPGNNQDNQPAAEYLNHYITHDYQAANEPWTVSTSDRDSTPEHVRYGEGAVHDPHQPANSAVDEAHEPRHGSQYGVHEAWGAADAAWDAPHGDPSTAFGSGDTSSDHVPTDQGSVHSFTHVDAAPDEFDPVRGYAEHEQHERQPDDPHTSYPGDDPSTTYPGDHAAFPGSDTDDSYTDAHHA